MDKIAEAKLAVRHENWKRMYEDYQNSGMKVREWCSEQGISVKTFYYRLRVIREEMLKNDVVHEIVPITACVNKSQTVTESTKADYLCRRMRAICTVFQSYLIGL